MEGRGRTDYARIAADYARGRALDARLLETWTALLSDHLPAARPLRGLDLGSGTGRFSPALAEAFGPVTAVEPSAEMRAVAERDAAHPGVAYLAGSAEAVPAADASLDYCWMYLVWHHVTDRERAAREVARVLRPGGVLVCRTQLADRMPDLWWLRHFPGGAEADAAMYHTLEQDLTTFGAAGLTAAPGLVSVAEPSLGTRADRLDRLRTRTLSVLHRLPDQDFLAGIASLEAEVALEPDSPAPADDVTLLVLRKQS